MYPTKVRTNMRYRGPVESGKLNQTQEELHADILALYQRVEQQQTTLSALWDDIRYGADDIAGEDDVHSRLRKISVQLATIEGGVKHV